MYKKVIGMKLSVVVFLLAVSLSFVTQELPVKKVVIYKNGISYIERETNLNGSGQVQLKFKARQMRDILKTLFAIPVNTGTIQNIDYQSEDPVSKKLEDINIPLPNENTLTGLLKGLQGVKIKLSEGSSEEKEVTILGIEKKRKVLKDANLVEEEPYLIYFDSDGIIDKAPVEFIKLKILDENIKKDFEKLLTILNSTKYADQKNVSIYYKNFNNSDIRVGYVAESPIWKTTYRIFLDAKPSALLQSFAIIENDTLDDWKDVQITLVGSGPFSYLVDLYTTIIPSRPTISIDDLFGIVKAREDRGFYGGRFSVPPSAPGRVMQDKAWRSKKETNSMEEEKEGAYDEMETAQAYERKAEKIYKATEPLANVISRGLQATSEGKSLGEYFSYEITQPITILRGNAGLVNIVSANIDGEKIVYYNEIQSRDTLNAFYLKNNTKNVLDNGFITFFEGQSTVGEGYLKTQLKPDEKEIITYGIEKSVTIETSIGSNSTGYTSIKLTNGVLTAQYYSYNEKKYKIFNKAQKHYTLIIDYDKRLDWELMEPTDISIREDLPNIYRFRVSLKPNATTEFKVIERKLLYEYIYFDINNINRIAYIISTGKLSDAAKKIVEESMKTLKEITVTETEINRLANRNSYLSDQLRIIRENINVLYTGNPEEAKIREKHIKNLDKYVTEYEQNENKRDELVQKKNNMKEELGKLISSYSE